jgi:hypothetical protein
MNAHRTGILAIAVTLAAVRAQSSGVHPVAATGRRATRRHARRCISTR